MSQSKFFKNLLLAGFFPVLMGLPLARAEDGGEVVPPEESAAPARAVAATEATASDSETRRLTLEESIDLAQKGATSILKSELDRDFSGTALTQGYLQFLPTLTAQGSYSYLKGKTFLTTAAPTLVKGSNYGPGYQISSTLNIFNGLSDISALRAANARSVAAKESFERVKQQIALDISQSFLQVILDQKLIDIAERNLRASRDRQTLLEEQSKVGVRSLSDLFRQQAQTSTDESFLITQQNRKQNDLILLLRKLRLDPSCKCALVEPPLEAQVEKANAALTPPAAEPKLIEQALANRRDYEVAKRTADATRMDIYSSRANYFPKLDLVGTYGASARHFDYQIVNNIDVTPVTEPSFDSQLRDRNYYTYGLVLTWNIFDRWTTSVNVQRAKVAAGKARIDAEDFRRQVVGEVKQAVSEFNSALKQLEASQKGLAAARKAFEVSQGRYEVGQLSFVDLAAAQSALVQVEANRAQALVGFELQKRAMDFALGL